MFLKTTIMLLQSSADVLSSERESAGTAEPSMNKMSHLERKKEAMDNSKVIH